MPQSAPTTFLSPAEAAREFGVTAATVSRWATEGRLPYIKTLGGHFRFRREDVERLVAGERAG